MAFIDGKAAKLRLSVDPFPCASVPSPEREPVMVKVPGFVSVTPETVIFGIVNTPVRI